ncbi:phage tail protein [Spartinivicinus marinus]|uniref:phage tail protein n=1 Tax=Spartinivicinus marinus TaxID=2994442 RepID=UPI00225282C5|nr:phage tail protein [Spartinivicinus marinus]MCX4027833.1 phage tail protein [Spartinivicinus marinus]
MSYTLLKLGDFIFSIKTASYQKLRQQWQFKWASQPIIGGYPQQQYTGETVRTMALSGTMYPGQYGSRDSLLHMVELAGTGAPFILVAGTGEILGYWCITQVSESGTYPDKEGVCRKIEFSVSITYYGDSIPNKGR